MDGLGTCLAGRLVPDAQWEVVEPLLPGFRVPPAGLGGRRRWRSGRCSPAIVYVLTADCSWRHLPEEFGCKPHVPSDGNGLPLPIR
ncbi:transposase, partial [Frankia sp. Cr1]|uniref:transposase n=1 Tax=Frankia sp. Cr1 TaxID=3073931 RepID=UPI002AD1F535